jgi:DNA-binding NarL/FixJ family response regulator
MISSTILIIEEHEILRRALCGWLQAIFPAAQVVEAMDQAEALVLAQAHLPDVVIVSHSAIGGRDLQVVQQLKTRLPMTAIVILASFVDESYRACAMAAGASVVIPTQNVSQELQPTLQALVHSLSKLG